MIRTGKKLSVLFLASGQAEDYKFSGKFRVYNYQQYLIENNCRVKVIPWNDEYADLASVVEVFSRSRYFRRDTLSKAVKLLSVLLWLPFYDILVIQRTRFPRILLVLLRMINKNLIYDFDDALYVPFPGLGIPEWTAENAPLIKDRFFTMLPYYRLIIAGNKYLAEKAREANPNVVVIPTPVDTTNFTMSYRTDISPPYTIGWVGAGEQHLEHLRLLKEPICRLSRKHPLRLRIIGAMGSTKIRDLFSTDGQFILDISDFLPQDELVGEIKNFTVGVMPLVDDEWSRGKCGYKALLYMACGVPSIASPVGINRDIIEDGVNGFLASTCEEWERAIETLITTPERRNNMSAAGRKTIELKYSQQVCEKQFYETLVSIIR